jgi:mono/diheme cytochrome c family protein
VAAETGGKAPKRLRIAFAATSLVFLGTLAISPLRDTLLEWRHYERAFVHFAESRQDSKRLLADFQPGVVDQIWVPQLGVVDRCTTCHQGVSQPSLNDPSIPPVFRAHPPMPHPISQWGCVVCHRGQGRATEIKEAHETTLAWEQPILPINFAQASCGACHADALPETPRLNRGRELLVRLNCVGCHRVSQGSRPPMLGPDLTNVGTKVSREWIYKWLKEPRTVTDKDGNVVVNGVDNSQELRMPQFRLTDAELRALSGYLSSLKQKPIEPAHFDARVLAAWAQRPDTVDEGETRFRQMFCTTCHQLSTTRAGETILIGGNIGPELSKVGSKVNLDWLVLWLRNPQGYLAHSQMPRYGWSDEDLYKVTRYIQTKLTDPDLLKGIPSLGEPTPPEIDTGKRLFAEKGCASCHVVDAHETQSDFGPDLSALGGKTTSQLEFGSSKIPRTLIAYIQAKISDPQSVNAAARMPQYSLSPETLDDLTTALLSMTGEPATPAMAKLTVPAQHPDFRPAGQFGELYERFKCASCHKFNGYGGTLAPDLSYEGSRAQRAWLIGFLKNPQTLRPMLTLRMPQFNMTDQEAATIADYLGLVMQSPDVSPEPAGQKDSSELARLGKELYEVKYQCQSCHTIGAAGGYVGPNLSNVGTWLRPEWIEAWLRDPQQLVPDTIEPRLSLTDDEVKELAAYLETLRQAPTKPGAGQ